MKKDDRKALRRELLMSREENASLRKDLDAARKQLEDAKDKEKRLEEVRMIERRLAEERCDQSEKDAQTIRELLTAVAVAQRLTAEIGFSLDDVLEQLSPAELSKLTKLQSHTKLIKELWTALPRSLITKERVERAYPPSVPMWATVGLGVGALLFAYASVYQPKTSK